MDMSVVERIAQQVAQAVAEHPGIADQIKGGNWSSHQIPAEQEQAIHQLMESAPMRQAKAIAAEQGWWVGVGGGGMAGLVAGGMGGAGVVWRGEQKKGVWVGLGSIGAQAVAGAHVICFIASDIDKWNGFTSGGVASAGFIGGIGIIGLSQAFSSTDGTLVFAGLELGVNISLLLGGRGTFDA